MTDSSPFHWLEQRGPACHLIAMIDDPLVACGNGWSHTIPPKKICALYAAGSVHG